jgi:5-methyltetrahydrofolate--homocysteine methyltransferase
MQPLLERLAESTPLIADGGMGTMLFQHGVNCGQCPESVCLSHPALLEKIAGQYLDAGAQLVETNTFGASSLKLEGHGLADQADEIVQTAVAEVRRAAGGRAYIAGSCGPTGRILQPYGDADPEAVRASFRRQMRAFAEAGIDAVCVETMTDLTEAGLAIAAAKEAMPTLPVLATMTFDRTPRGFFTLMGVTIEQAAAGLRAAGADVVGSNCGNGIEAMVEIAREFRQHTDLPLLIQANAGLPELKDGRPVYPETPEFMADKARELVAIGVDIIGGCCGTTPGHIRALRAMVDAAA